MTLKSPHTIRASSLSACRAPLYFPTSLIWDCGSPLKATVAPISKESVINATVALKTAEAVAGSFASAIDTLDFERHLTMFPPPGHLKDRSLVLRERCQPYSTTSPSFPKRRRDIVQPAVGRGSVSTSPMVMRPMLPWGLRNHQSMWPDCPLTRPAVRFERG